MNIRMMTAGAMLCAATSAPALAMDIVDGAACAHLARQIEGLGVLNEDLLNAISEAQVVAGASKAQDVSGPLIERHRAMVGLRQNWIVEYESKCANASLNVKDLQRICRPAGGLFPLRDTVFCKPARDAGL